MTETTETCKTVFFEETKKTWVDLVYSKPSRVVISTIRNPYLKIEVEVRAWNAVLPEILRVIARQESLDNLAKKYSFFHQGMKYQNGYKYLRDLNFSVKEYSAHDTQFYAFKLATDFNLKLAIYFSWDSGWYPKWSENKDKKCRVQNFE